MTDYLIRFCKIVLTVFQLRVRTVLARFKVYSNRVKPLENRTFQNFAYSYQDRSAMKLKQERSELYFTGFDKKISLNTISQIGSLNDIKNDYLFVYTCFYLSWLTNANADKTTHNALKTLLASKFRWQPFIISQQIFAFLTNHNMCTRLLGFEKFEHELQRMHEYLRNNIEYHVDGNHVLENLIALSWVEMAFGEISSRTKKLLSQEILRQSCLEGHVEKNYNYTSELLHKLMPLVEENILPQSCVEKLNVWQNVLKYQVNYPLHDNFNGTAESVPTLQTCEDYGIDLQDMMPKRGFRGHAFDCKYSLGPLLSHYVNVRPFGTYTYANCNRRHFQRSRSNNGSICYSQSTKSAFFWKSFRCIGVLPSVKFKLQNNHYRFYELVFDRSFKILQYDVKIETKKKLRLAQEIKLGFFFIVMKICWNVSQLTPFLKDVLLGRLVLTS